MPRQTHPLILLSEVGALGLRYIEARNKELVDTQAELERVSELYHKVREENEIINEQQRVITELLAMIEMKPEECRAELTVGKERRITLEAELKRVITRHSTNLERIIREC